MDQTVALAKTHKVLVGAHPSLPDRQGFGRREMAMEPVCVSVVFVNLRSSLWGSLGGVSLMLYLSSRCSMWLLAEARAIIESRK